jgi:hypothetical protein
MVTIGRTVIIGRVSVTIGRTVTIDRGTLTIGRGKVRSAAR